MHDQKAIKLNNRLPKYTLSCKEALVHAHIAHRENISPETSGGEERPLEGGRIRGNKKKLLTSFLEVTLNN